jgi:hypothetical protein
VTPRRAWAEVSASRPEALTYRSGALAEQAARVESALVARFGSDDAAVVLDSDPGKSWARRVRPHAEACRSGQRLVFSVLSRPYLIASKTHAPVPAAATIAGLAEFAREEGFDVVGIVGYGFLLGHPLGRASLLAPTDTTQRWRRLLSWLSRNDELAELATYLDLEVATRLPASASPRLMVVLEKGRTAREPEVLPPSGTFDEAVAKLPVAQLSAALDGLLEPVRARQLAFALLDHFAVRRPGSGLEQLLSPRRAAQYEQWATGNRIDRGVTRVARHWSDGCGAKMRHETDLTLSMDYPLVRKILEDYLHVYTDGFR